jgi:hypothetical protein
MVNDTTGRSTRFQGLQQSVWIYDLWFQYKVCLFEKKMRIPITQNVGRSKASQL